MGNWAGFWEDLQEKSLKTVSSSVLLIFWFFSVHQSQDLDLEHLIVDASKFIDNCQPRSSAVFLGCVRQNENSSSRQTLRPSYILFSKKRIAMESCYNLCPLTY